MISGLIICSDVPRMLVGGQLTSTNPTDKTGQQKQGHTSHSIFQLLVTGSILPLLKPTGCGNTARARGNGGKRRGRRSTIVQKEVCSKNPHWVNTEMMLLMDLCWNTSIKSLGRCSENGCRLNHVCLNGDET